MKFKAQHLINYFVLCFVCAVLQFTIFKQDLATNLLFYIVHFILSFWILKRISGKIFIQDVRVVFLVSYALYTIILPLSVLYDSQTELYFYSYDDRGVNGTLILSTLGLYGFNFALMKFQVPWVRQIKVISTEKIKSGFATLIFLVLIICSLVAFLYVQGIPVTLSVGNGRLATGSQIWVFLTLILNGVFLFLFSNFSRLGTGTRLFAVGLFIVYAYIILVPLGARRELIVIISLLIFFLFEKYKASFKNIFIIVSFFLFFIIVGAIREFDAANISAENVIKYVIVNNEFSIPARHTITYLKNADWNLLYGWSYIYFPIIFIPRAFLAGYKPVSLAWQTDTLFHTSSGAAAFTPITEAYINFSWLGPVLVFFLLGYFYSYAVKKYSTKPLLYILLFTTALDFNRGEFALVLYQIAFLFMGYFITQVLSTISFNAN